MPEPLDPFEIPDLTNPLWSEGQAPDLPAAPDYQKQADSYLDQWHKENDPQPQAKALPQVSRATQVKVEANMKYRDIPDYDVDPEKPAGEPVPYVDKRPNVRTGLSGKYDRTLIKDMIEIGKDEGVDPYWLMATALQETNMGKLSDPHKKNYGPGSGKVFNLESNPLNKKQEAELATLARQERKTLGNEASARRHQIRKVIQMYRNKERESYHFYMKKLGRAPTQAERIQAWQGYGKAKRWKGMKVFGGQSGSDLLGWRDIPHGKVIIAHMKSLKENINIRDLVEGTN